MAVVVCVPDAKLFLQLSGQESLKDLVEMVSACQEFYDIKVRA